MHNVGNILEIGGVQYEIAQVMPPGGFGVVYKAMPVGQPSKPVAIKVPHAHVLADAKWSKKFEREARILANIGHPNVVRVIKFVKNPTGMYLIQEWAADAKELSVCFPTMSDPERLSVSIQVLFALRATHGVSVEACAIHRDLSPRNILIDPSGRVKVIDFGLAKENPRITAVLTLKGETFGTPGCIAPEQLTEAADVDHRADLYALGRTLAAGIQNRRPEHADISQLPEPWKGICDKLARYVSAERHASAEEAISDLLAKFCAAGVFPSDMGLMQQEFSRWPGPPLAWTAARTAYLLNKRPYDRKDLALAYQIPRSELADPALQIDEFLSRLDAEVIDPHFSAALASFEECDPLGKFLESVYGALSSQAAKEVCFRRLAKTAVLYNRYYVMTCVRSVFLGEGDQTVKTALQNIIRTEDPSKAIHGIEQ